MHYSLHANVVLLSKNSILRWVKNFRATASALKRKQTGRPVIAKTLENVVAVRASVLQSPRRSTIQRTLVLEIYDRSLQRILHKVLHVHPYKIICAQELSERDINTHTTLCLEIQQHASLPWTLVLFTDEAHFHLCCTVNKQNFRYWTENNSQELHQRPSHSPRVSVWCAIAESGIWGSYFFEKTNVTVTVTSDRYCEMLETFVGP